ncbi:MAG: hypothetical protein ABI629_15015 [bacterium]
MNRFLAAGAGLFLVVGTVAVARAETETVTGEIVDTFCYSAMGAKGASHRQCAIDCAKKGIPLALLENGTNKIYVLLPNKDKTALPDEVTKKIAEQVSITGNVHATGESNFLTVESIK